jgi:hypothetical protein
MNFLVVSIMLFGAFACIPSVLGKDVVHEITKSVDTVLERPYLSSLYSIVLIKDILAIFLMISSISFWYYWPRGMLTYETSLSVIISVSIISIGLLYLADHLLLQSPSISKMPFKMISYIIFVISFIGSIGVIWIPTSSYLVVRFWKLLTTVPLYVSTIGGYILFMAGLFLFVMFNQ